MRLAPEGRYGSGRRQATGRDDLLWGGPGGSCPVGSISWDIYSTVPTTTCHSSGLKKAKQDYMRLNMKIREPEYLYTFVLSHGI
jgi:hypothetical protein